MTNLKTTKRALFTSVIALLLCFTMLLGTTFAWFTDSVTSDGNIIKSGTLKVNLEWASGKEDPSSVTWTNVEEDDTPIFKNTLWEPGYTEARHIKISNVGTLALKYQLAIIPTGEVSDLADVIDVYLYEIADTDDNARQVANRTAIDETMYVGSLADVISKGIVQGNLAADTYYTTTVVLKMQEDAGDEYQNLQIGDEFTIQLLATQYTAEGDSFDNQYDADAWVPGMQVYTASDLQAAINAGENVTLMNDIELDSQIVIPASAVSAYSMRAANETVINLNGKNITTDGATAIRNEGNLRIVGEGKISSVSGYAIRVQTGSLVIDSNDVEVSSDFGAISVFNGATVTINGGNYLNRGYEGKTSHTIYLGGYGTININGGTFDSGYSNGGIDTICGYGWSNASGQKAIININGGTFYPSELNGSYYFISNYDGAWTEINLNGGTYHKYSPDKINGTKMGTDVKSVEKDGMYYVVSDTVNNVIVTPADLAALGGTKINGTYMLMADLDMTGYDMKPIQLTSGSEQTLTFIGNGHTISNLNLVQDYQNGMYVAGLFNILHSGKELTVNDLILSNVTSTSEKYAAAVVAYNSTTLTINLNNVDVKDATVNAETVAALVSYSTGAVNLTDCNVSGLALTGEVGRPEKVGAYIGTANQATCEVTVNNCTNATTYGDYGRVINGAKWNGAVVVSASTQEALDKIVSSGNAVDMTLSSGNYEMPDGSEGSLQGKTITISGTRDTVIDATNIDARDQFITGANVVFDGVTLNFGTVNYMGFANTASLTYKNCQINGLQFLFGENVTFENCDFNSNGAEHCVWTYGAKNVTFTDCDFTYGDRGINCYSDNDVVGGKQTVSFTNCTFATENTSSEGAVEINSCFFSVGIEVNLNGCTAPAYGEMAYVSPWDSTNGAKTTINIQ